MKCVKYKRIKFRLYGIHDRDLLKLEQLHDVNLEKSAYIALKALLNNDLFVFSIPPCNDKVYQSTLCKSYYLSFNEVTDKECIEFLDAISDGYKNIFLRFLLRTYFGFSIVDDMVGKKKQGSNDAVLETDKDENTMESQKKYVQEILRSLHPEKKQDAPVKKRQRKEA